MGVSLVSSCMSIWTLNLLSLHCFLVSVLFVLITSLLSPVWTDVHLSLCNWPVFILGLSEGAFLFSGGHSHLPREDQTISLRSVEWTWWTDKMPAKMVSTKNFSQLPSCGGPFMDTIWFPWSFAQFQESGPPELHFGEFSLGLSSQSWISDFVIILQDSGNAV